MKLITRIQKQTYNSENKKAAGETVAFLFNKSILDAHLRQMPEDNSKNYQY